MSYADDVKKFMIACDQPIREQPTVISDQEKWERYSMLNEEFSEMKKALADLKKANEYHDKTGTKDALVEVANALVDIVYVAIGTAHTYGFDFDDLFRAVHENNLSKLDPETGKAIKANGKVQKPDGYVPVDLRSRMFPCKH